MLLEAHADPDLGDEDGICPLAATTSIDVAQLLLEHKANPNKPNNKVRSDFNCVGDCLCCVAG